MIRILNFITGIWVICIAATSASYAEPITILRGAKSEIVTTAHAGGAVHILRGKPGSTKKKAPAKAPRKVIRSGFESIGAGGALWLREKETGRLTNCSVWGSGMVGKDVIRCTSTLGRWRSQPE